MTLFEQFINNFGEWSVAELCKVKDLPFLDDIKRLLDAVAVVEVDDGHRTFNELNELYAHRHALFASLVSDHADKAFKTRKNHEGKFLEGWFVLGLDTPYGQITYCLPESYWGHVSAKEVESNFDYDGHTPKDVLERLLLLSEAK